MSRKSKSITHIAMVVRPVTGGIRSHVRTLVTGLDPARFCLSLYGPSDLDIPATVAPHTQLGIGARTQPIADLVSILRLGSKLRALDNAKPIVHAHGLRGALIAVPAARIAGLPAMFTAHNLLPDLNGKQLSLLRRVAHGSAAIVAVSAAVSEQLTSAGIHGPNIVVIPNGIDPARFAQRHDPLAVRSGLGIPANGPLIVAIGRLAPEKGFDVLLRAMQEPPLVASGAQFALAGAGPAEADLRRLAQTPTGDRPSAVHLLGAVTDVAPLLAAADLVAIPSRMEGQGIVALEAMAAGKAVVASKVGGLVETVTDGKCGLLVPPEDPAALAKALAVLLATPLQRVRFGQAGRNRVMAKYTTSNMVTLTSGLYDAVTDAYEKHLAQSRH